MNPSECLPVASSAIEALEVLRQRLRELDEAKAAKDAAAVRKKLAIEAEMAAGDAYWTAKVLLMQARANLLEAAGDVEAADNLREKARVAATD